jgi:glycolate oxidase FAD binding subunit
VSRTTDALVEAVARLVGADVVRPAGPADAFAPVSPRVVVTPPDAEAACSVLAWASRDGVPLAIRGSGSKLDWGPPMRAAEVILSTARLQSVVAHRYGDLTATVQAGATLAVVNREMGARGQLIALDPCHAERATIGGILATNDSGPRRHRYGQPRDQIIGITVARADGKIAKAGGIVVKNVAGYDLGRLMTGSYGTLALTLDATFKLVPIARASRTVILTPGSLPMLGTVLTEIAAGQTMPSAVEVEMPPGRLLVRFETSERAVEEQAGTITAIAARHAVRWALVAGEEEAAVWRAHAERPWNGPGCILKVSLRPAQLVHFVQGLRDPPEQPPWELVGRAALGVLLLRIEGSEADQARVVAHVRGRFKGGAGYASMLRASPELKARLGAWDSPGDALALMQRIKRQFDPAGILNHGRAPGGL